VGTLGDGRGLSDNREDGHGTSQIGLALVAAVAVAGGALTVPPAWRLVAAAAGTLLAVAALTAIPARLGARRPVAEILQSELA
jgi:hypothetical protein